MEELKNLLYDAFDAGIKRASAYEMGGWARDFNQWYEENKSEIESVDSYRLLQRIKFLKDEINSQNDNIDSFHQKLP